MIRLEFDAGSLLVTGSEEELSPILPLLTPDPRVGAYRALACQYRSISAFLTRFRGDCIKDEVPEYRDCHWQLQTKLTLRPYQQEALDAWDEGGRHGVVVLPTGVGKSLVGVNAIARAGFPAIIILPTIELMNQWASQLEEHFGVEVGMLGGGSKDVRDLTVSTYDSASLMMEFLGNRFGTIIFDECHHLPTPTYRIAAEMSAAPCRLGLSATPERDDGGEEVLYDLLGPLVYRREIDEFEKSTLSPYNTKRMQIVMDPDELLEYERNRGRYRDFIRRNGIRMGSPNGWGQFLQYCARSPDGPEVIKAYQKQKRIAGGGKQKVATIWKLLKKHAGERTIIFTALNDLAYQIGETFLLPVLTHLTKAAERKAFMERFREGSYTVMVTSRVLNEGIDVPDASVGIVVSGSGSVREHVQRLGRILRPKQGKQATLYELVSAGTSEVYTSDRRRQHRAYKRRS